MQGTMERSVGFQSKKLILKRRHATENFPKAFGV